jgi:hypothetical protein
MKKIVKSCIAAALLAVSLFAVSSCSQNIDENATPQAEIQTLPAGEENSPERCIAGPGITGVHGTYGPSSYSSGN